MHGYRHPANAWAGADGICRACLTCFWSRHRLMRHLAVDIASCLHLLQVHEPPYGDDALSGHLVEGATFQRHQRRSGLDVRKATLPAIRVYGPPRECFA
eukprot:4979953-Alexandrium_andersonii.AAC.1